MSKLDFLQRKAEYPRITKRLDLGRYHKKLRGQYLDVWLNWDREFQERWLDSGEKLQELQAMPVDTEEQRGAQQKAVDDYVPRYFELFGEYLGCSAEEVETLFNLDTNLWLWITEEVGKMRARYLKKQSRRR
jgi:GTP-dependent phosphoenolpyruvate carboxykinase